MVSGIKTTYVRSTRILVLARIFYYSTMMPISSSDNNDTNVSPPQKIGRVLSASPSKAEQKSTKKKEQELNVNQRSEQKLQKKQHKLTNYWQALADNEDEYLEDTDMENNNNNNHKNNKT